MNRSVASIYTISKNWCFASHLQEHHHDDAHEGVRGVCEGGWAGGHGNKGPTHEPEVNQCCSGAKWVPIEVLEKGYDHIFGL